MRIVLLYPPPWKIPAKGEAPDAPDAKDGPPKEYREGDLDPDFYQTPYGLFTLGAQAMRAEKAGATAEAARLRRRMELAASAPAPSAK